MLSMSRLYFQSQVLFLLINEKDAYKACSIITEDNLLLTYFHIFTRLRRLKFLSYIYIYSRPFIADSFSSLAIANGKIH